MHFPILFDNVFASFQLRDSLLTKELDAGLGVT